MEIKFYDDRHENHFYAIMEKMRSHDCYHQALAYLIALDRVCREHISDLFDFERDIILNDGLNHSWQTGTSCKTTRLAFNLWCDFVDEDDAKYSTPSELFCCSYAPYYCEAIRLRYPEYMGEV